MKALLRSLAAAFMALLARAVLKKYRPTIVMVTGSVGKTSTKDACAAALGKRYFLRASEKSYNSEFGVPLTIIGAKNPWANPLAWLQVIEEALALILLPAHYPKLLILEVGADRPGDLRQILRIATPDAVVVTRLPEMPVHVEAYATPSAVREEEFTPAYALADGAPLIVCEDDAHARTLAVPLRAQVTTYGEGEGALARFSNVRTYEEEKHLAGMQADVVAGSYKGTLTVHGALGRQQLYAPAAALALGLALGMTAEETMEGLASYVPPPGRARILPGINGSILIDDSYNASPAAAEEILRSLDLVKGTGRRITILGDMLELGRYSMEEHARIGALAAKHADVVIGVGTRSRAIADAAQGTEALHFDDSLQAAEALPATIGKGDIVLVKGSQGVRMERVTKALLGNEADLERLVRQDPEWLRR